MQLLGDILNNGSFTLQMAKQLTAGLDAGLICSKAAESAYVSEIQSHLKTIFGDIVWRQCCASIVDEKMQLLA